MSDARASADIIPFPLRFRADSVPQTQTNVGSAPPTEVGDPTATEQPIDPQARLRAALAQLQEALAEQRIAVTAWRSALADLGGSVHGLRGSFETLQTQLALLKGQLPR